MSRKYRERFLKGGAGKKVEKALGKTSSLQMKKSKTTRSKKHIVSLLGTSRQKGKSCTPEIGAGTNVSNVGKVTGKLRLRT